ncbi:peptide chain release factor N(5)-glutamine methyltransferase [Bdellovibrio sp. HCB2-146]|uniref:peptide chain release factor N(5)-glutamine methyltransferase n=1 Tax=Bdellovibrio sp. HCB2-146 TaxID=3394362 RepID=UPI0039BC7B03
MKLKEVLDKTTAFFREKKIDTPRLDAELLLSHGLKLDRIQLYLKFDQPLSDAELATCRELVRRRSQGEPVAYIVGYKDFFGERFEVNSHTLIPRPETEHLIEEAMKWEKDSEKPLHILDLGCGSGCVGLTLLKKFPHARLVTVDISAEALEVAKRNAESLGVRERVFFVNEDAGNFQNVMASYQEFMGQEKIDILVSNPPYIAEEDPLVDKDVRKFEPHTALFAADSGLALLKQWSSSYSEKLSRPGLLLMEMGMSQGAAMLGHLEKLGKFNEVRVIKDLSGHDRVLRGVING